MSPGARWLACALLAVSEPLGAHPIDEVVQGAYITLAPGEIQLELDITPGVEVAQLVLKAIDANGDRRIDAAEGRAFAEAVLRQSISSVDGRPVIWTMSSLRMPPYENLLTGNDTISIRALAKRFDAAGAHTLAYENAYEPAKTQRIANIFVRPGGGWRFVVTGQRRSDDGSRLTVTYTVSR